MTNKATRANGSLAHHIKICVDNSTRNPSMELHHKSIVNGRTRGYKISQLHFRVLHFSGTTKDINVNSVLYGGINSSPPSAAYIRQWTRWALVQVMVFRLFGAKPLPEPMRFLSIGLLGTNFNEIQTGILSFSFSLLHLMMRWVK